MRNRTRSVLVALVALVSVMATGCQDPPGPSPVADRQAARSELPTVLKTAYRSETGLVLPAGTRLSNATDVAGRHFLRYDLPAGWMLAAEDQAGRSLEMMSGGIRCTCTQGSNGCSPYHIHVNGKPDIVGCAISGDCTKCQKEEQAMRTTPHGLELVAVRAAAVLHRASGVSFVSDPAVLDSLPCASAAVLNSAAVREALTAFLDANQRRDRARARQARTLSELPPGYEMALVNAFGRVVRVPVQRGATFDYVISSGLLLARLTARRHGIDLDTADAATLERLDRQIDAQGREAVPAAEGGSCKCTSGSTGCTYHRYRIPGVGYAEYCEAGDCTSCQLNINQS